VTAHIWFSWPGESRQQNEAHGVDRQHSRAAPNQMPRWLSDEASRRMAAVILQPLKIGGTQMNDDILKGQWTQLKGKVREQWGKLTNDDLDVVRGESEQLVGRIQERYGVAKDEAHRQVNDWLKSRRETVTKP
jgi:uncharacterized protein YjbJ (UPF0337 family)